MPPKGKGKKGGKDQKKEEEEAARMESSEPTDAEIALQKE